MNTQLLNDIADQIEKHPHSYDQRAVGRRWEDDAQCKAPCCVAGWAILLSGERLDREQNTFDVALKALQLRYEQLRKLYAGFWPLEWFPPASHEDPERFSPQELRTRSCSPRAHEAAYVLRRVAKGDLAL